MLKELLFDRVIVLPVEQDEITTSGLSIPANAENTPRYGKVIQAGTEIKHCKVDDFILWRKDGGDEIIFNNVVHLIMVERDVIGIV